MISVLTLTYKRHHLLEEAIESFLRQNTSYPKEMVVINDNKDVDYVFDHPEVRIINHKNRFPSISAKLKWGFEQCKYDHVYRLDDDDLLAPTGLQLACDDIVNNPDYDVYRAAGFYFFVNNKFERIVSSINNGNIYARKYINRIKWPHSSIGEDAEITFHQGANIYESKSGTPTMVYRWGMNTFHLSGGGDRPSELALQQADESFNRIGGNIKGTVELKPRFKHDYYQTIKTPNVNTAPVDKLTEIANSLGTDKGTSAFCKHSYTVTYNELFESLIPKHVRMLEIGVADPRFPGASTKMWRQYFPNLTFVGYDINPEATQFAQEGVAIFIGDQNNPADLQRCIQEHGSDWDIIIDDGSHYGEHVITTFREFYKHLKPNGYYIVEDMHAVFMHATETIREIHRILEEEGHEFSNFYQEHGGKLLIIKK